MTNRALTLLAFACLACGSLPARAEGPVYKDAERFGPDRLRRREARLSADEFAPVRAGRVLTGGPGYVGSDYGLGKPAFTGLGSRPDWGRGGE